MTSVRRTIICFFLLLPGLFVFLPNAARADVGTEIGKQTGAFVGAADLGKNPRDPRLIVAYTIQILLGLVGIIFIAYIVYAGYVLAFSGGEEDKINTAKATIRRSTIGLLIILSAYSITLFVARLATGGQSQFDAFNSPDAQIDPDKGVGDTLLDFVNPASGCQVLPDSDGFLVNDPLGAPTQIGENFTGCETLR